MIKIAKLRDLINKHELIELTKSGRNDMVDKIGKNK